MDRAQPGFYSRVPGPISHYPYCINFSQPEQMITCHFLPSASYHCRQRTISVPYLCPESFSREVLPSFAIAFGPVSRFHEFDERTDSTPVANFWRSASAATPLKFGRSSKASDQIQQHECLRFHRDSLRHQAAFQSPDRREK